MPSLGLGLQLGRSGAAGAGLDFSALTALPSASQSAVTTAANTAAATLSVTPQSIIDALSVGRGLCSMLPNDGCLLASSGGAVTVQGDPVGAIRSWTGVELATQSNASLQPISGATALLKITDDVMSLTGLSAGPLEACVVMTPQALTRQGLWSVGSVISDVWVPWIDNAIYDSFGTSTRINSSSLSIGTIRSKFIYQPSFDSGTLTLRINGNTVVSQGGLTASIISTPVLFRSPQSADASESITLHALALNLSVYTTQQRAAIEQFCKAYYGVTY